MDELTLVRIWPVIIAILVFIIWLIRLEAKVLYVTEQFKTKYEEDSKKFLETNSRFDNVQSMLTTILQTLGKLEGIIEAQKKG